MELLGIDNVFFEVENIDQAISWYERLGFRLKFRMQQVPMALLSIGKEIPGLMLRQVVSARPSKFWIEVTDAYKVQEECKLQNISGNMIETATGFTLEIADESGNIVGFADYCKKPELARTYIK